MLQQPAGGWGRGRVGAWLLLGRLGRLWWLGGPDRRLWIQIAQLEMGRALGKMDQAHVNGSGTYVLVGWGM